MGWEVVVTERSSWGHSSGDHGLLLGHRWLSLLVGPVATNSSGAEPLAIHGAKSLLGILTLTKCNESVTTRSSSFHVPHNSCLGNRAKCRESLKQNLIVDLV